MMPRIASAFLVSFAAALSWAGPSPEDVFWSPPPEAHAGVWWHWMGSQVTREGIVKDLDWMRRMGISEATIFGMCDSTTPWAKRIANVPTGNLRPFSEAWWKLVQFACAEAKTRGIGIGLHNCPGYTCTGGPWIPPRLAMRELVFNVTNAEQISTKPNALFPVYDEDAREFRLPPCAARRTDYRRLGNVDGVEIGHVPMGAFVQPADWDTLGLECDKMNPEAVAFHLDHVFGEMKRHLGNDLPAAGLSFVLLDSYEAGTPTWTPRMREEFQARRGYDCWRFLPILGGFTNRFAAAEITSFRKDWDRTVADLYRDVLFAQMAKRVRAEGLRFANEPYEGPFVPREAAMHVDRLMTEFWYEPNQAFDRVRRYRHADFNTFLRADGMRHNVVEAEAFTGWPTHCAWTETPGLMKACGDHAWLNGVNRFVLHTCPLQPWGDDVKPGVTMGRWGTHFGRNQTWAESGRCWFDYVARAQALLQWGRPSSAKLAVPFPQFAREDGERKVHFLVNDSDAEKPLALAGGGSWFDPVSGTIGAAPKTLAPRQSGFWVAGGKDAGAAPVFDAAVAVMGWTPALGDWTKSADPETKYFSGTRVYRAAFACAAPADAELSLGVVLGATARVVVNGVDCGTAWCAPWKVAVPRAAVRAGANEVVVEVVNVWANRLIGDEQEPADVAFAASPLPAWPDSDVREMMLAYPDWFKDGLAARPSKGRRCFTTWNFFTKDSPLVPSGLVGPVSVAWRR